MFALKWHSALIAPNALGKHPAIMITECLYGRVWYHKHRYTHCDSSSHVFSTHETRRKVVRAIDTAPAMHINISSIGQRLLNSVLLPLSSRTEWDLGTQTSHSHFLVLAKPNKALQYQDRTLDKDYVVLKTSLHKSRLCVNSAWMLEVRVINDVNSGLL